MKRLFFPLFVLITTSARTQDKTIQAQVKQISLLELYIGWIEKGYDIAKKGLTTISDIKDGHWKMDIDFFNSLKNVNPKIKEYAKVAAIIDYQSQIIKQCASLKKQSFNNDEVSYINSVITHLLEDCGTLVDQLTMIITDKQVQMSDDERIKNIDRIYNDVQDQYCFVKNFSDQAKLLIRNRAKELNDIRVSQQLRGL